MDSWTQVILEWVNCLNLLESSVKHPKDLGENQIFIKIITSISSWKSRGKGKPEKELLLNFLHDEYPEFISESEGIESSTENVLVASLLLLRTSQEPTFHKPMCTKLDHETQIKIKMFLERTLAHENSITRDLLNSTISSLPDVKFTGQSHPKTPHMTPKGRPLKDFFNSPAARSIQRNNILTEKNFQLRELKSILETERCEKYDIIEDLKIQQEENQKLHKKLQEKEKELKSLRDEAIRPLTPQVQKNTDAIKSEVYKKEIKNLEKYISNLHKENEKLQDEKDVLMKKLTVFESQNTAIINESELYQSKFESFEKKIVENDREINNLRTENEELRCLLKETNKVSFNEESFECDNVNSASTFSLNSSEALSSVVEIQLQETKEETFRLKNEIDSITELLKLRDLECEKLEDLNKDLNKKVKSLEIIEKEFCHVKSELLLANTKVTKLSEENAILLEKEQSIKNQLEVYKTSENILNNKLLDLKSSLTRETAKNSMLESLISDCRIKAEDFCIFISKRENCNPDYQDAMELCTVNDTKMINIFDVCKYFDIVINSFKKLYNNNKSMITNLHQTAEERDRELSNFKIEIQKLNEQIKKHDVEESSLLNSINQANSEILLLQEIAEHRNVLLEKISKLEIDLGEKNVLIKSLDVNVQKLNETKNSLKNDILHRESSLKSLEEQLLNLNQQNALFEKDVELLKIKSFDFEQELIYKNNFITSLENKIETIEKNKILLEEKLNTKEEEYAQSQEELLAKILSIEGLELNIKKLSEDKCNLTEKLSSAKNDIFTLQENLKRKTEMINEQDTEKLTLLSTINQANSEIHLLKEIAEERKVLLEKLSKLEINLNEKNVLIKSLEANVEKLNEIKISLDDEMFHRDSCLKSLQEEMVNLNKQNSLFEKDVELLKTKSFDFEQELIHKNNFITSLENKIETFEKNEILLEEELNTRKEKYAQSQEELLAKRLSIEDLEQNIKKLSEDKCNLTQELTSVKNANFNLQEHLKQKVEIIQEYDTEKLNLLSTISEVNSKIQLLQEIAEERKVLLEKLSKVEINLDEKNILIKSLEANVEKLNETNNSLENEILHRETSLKALQEQLLNINKQSSLFEKDVELLKLKAFDFEQELIQKNNFIGSLENQIEKLEKNEFVLEETLNTNRVHYSQLQEELLEKKLLIEGLELNIKKLSENKFNLTQELTSVKNTNFNLQEHLKQNVQTIQEYDAEKSKLLSTISQTNSEILSLQEIAEQKNLLLERLSKLEVDLDDRNSLIKSLTESVDKLNEMKNSLENEMLHRETSLESLQEQLINLNKQNSLFEKDIELLKIKSFDFEQELIQKNNFIISLENKIETFDNNEFSLKEILNKNKKEYEKLKEELLETKLSIEGLELNIEKLSGDKFNLTEELTSIKIENSNLQQNLKQRTEMIQALEIDLLDIKQEKFLVFQDLETCTAKLATAEEEITQKIAIIESLEREFNILKNSIVSLEHELSSRSQELLKIQKELSCKIENVSALEDNVSILQKDVKEKDQRIGLLTTKEGVLEENKLTLSLELESTVQDLQKIETELSNSLEIIKAMENNITELKGEKILLEEKSNEFENKYLMKIEEIETLESSIKKLNLYKHSLEEQLDSMKKIFEKENHGNAPDINCIEKQGIQLTSTKNNVENSLNDKMQIIKQSVANIEDLEKEDSTCKTDFIKKESTQEQQEINNENCDSKVSKSTINNLEEINSFSSKEFEIKSELSQSDDEKQIKDHLIENMRIENETLENQIKVLKAKEENHQAYVEKLILKKEFLYEILLKASMIHEDFCSKLIKLEKNWSISLNEFYNSFFMNQSVCDELKNLHKEKTVLQNIVSSYSQQNLHILTFLDKISLKTFLWIEQRIKNIESKEDMELENEKQILLSEMKQIESTILDMDLTESKMESFLSMVNRYKEMPEVNRDKKSAENLNKLELQLQNLNKERRDLKEKLDNSRVRNAKLERNMDELRNELAKVKSNQTIDFEVEKKELDERVKSLQEEICNFHTETSYYKEENRCLKAEIDSLKSKEVGKNVEVQVSNLEIDSRMKNIHEEYESKLEKLKQKMKLAYNEQIQKLVKKQEEAVQEKVKSLQAEMEQQCRKHTEEINKYKEHVTELTSRHWEVCDKLLAEKQEKEGAFKQMKEMIQKWNEDSQQYRQKETFIPPTKTVSVDKRNFTKTDIAKGNQACQIIEEETFSRRCSFRSLQSMGSIFNAEDEEGEIFNNVYLADMKAGCTDSIRSDPNRLSVLQMRNSLCQPHLKSSYPAETQFHPLSLTEEDIKNGSTVEDVFNDSLSQSLLPGQNRKRRERTQTSYKKPGPPTPSKNGRRLSLQSSEQRSPSSRILKEKNSLDRRTTATPRRLMDIFSHSRQQDENNSGTPRRFSNLFRKMRLPTERK